MYFGRYPPSPGLAKKKFGTFFLNSKNARIYSFILQMHAGKISDEMLCAEAAGKDSCQANNLYQIIFFRSSHPNHLF